MRPNIGLSLDYQESGSFSKRPHYALRESYFNAIYKAGGLPIAVPYIEGALDDYLQNLQGFVIPGGDYALDDDWYVEKDCKKPYLPSPRLDFDIKLANRLLDNDIPLLGICAGMQIIGGILGCRLTADINHTLNTSINHLNHVDAEHYAHKVKVAEGSLLQKITELSEFEVNTAHIEAIVEVSDKVVVSGVAEDGAIEAIEVKGNKFALGVQWHPEFFLENDNPNFKLFKNLVEASKC